MTTKTSLIMKTSVQLKADNYYLVRRPLLSINELFALNSKMTESPDALWCTLKTIFRHPLLNEAIYLASPDLHEALEKLTNENKGDIHKMSITLYKYLSRMSTRCTPYGLFAGCSTGCIGEQTAIDYDKSVLSKQARLDMLYICDLTEAALTNNDIRENSRYIANSSIYLIGDTYRYIEYQVENSKRNYRLSSLKKSPYLEHALQTAGNYIRYNDLIHSLHAFDAELTKEEIAGFIDQLIYNQILVSELEPAITGQVHFDALAHLQAHINNPEISKLLGQLQTLLQQGGVSHFRQAQQLLNEQLGQVSSKDLIQTDLFFQHDINTLGRSAVETITSQLAVLFRFATANHSPELDHFKNSFIERFEEQEVPLVLALDAEAGIGYATQQGKDDLLPLVEGITPTAAAKDRTITWNHMSKLAAKLFQRAANTVNGISELTDEDLAQVAEPVHLNSRIPSSLFVFGSLLAPDSKAVDNGDFQFALNACTGPSCATLLGRFCHSNPELLDKVKESLKRDEADEEDLVYAEIVHLPEARTGNVLLRPHLRNYEIPFLGKSNMNSAHQITIQDLMISIRNGKVVLRSKSLNKTVIPRLSTAHNFVTGLPIYRFLCDLQRESLYYGFSWSWEHLSDSPFLPRVVYKNIILSRARWQMHASDLSTGILNNISSLPQLQQHLTSLNVPRHVCMKENDNELLLDLNTTHCLQILHQQLHKKGSLQLIEFLQLPGACFLESNAGAEKFTNEIILPVTNPLFDKSLISGKSISHESVKRTFVPGEEWLYFKLYGGTKSMDKLLKEKILPEVNHLLKNGDIIEWFYLRYTDPKHHLRVRLRVPSSKKQAIFSIICNFQKALLPELDQHLLHKIQLDTYERELERYGFNNIEDSEAVFYRDSQAIAEVLNLLEGESGETYRWLLAIRSVDTLLNDFGISLVEKSTLMHDLFQLFFQEFSGEKNLSEQLKNKFRQESKLIRSVLTPEDDEKNQLEEAIYHFTRRSIHLQEVVQRISDRFNGSLLKSTKGKHVLASYIHMSINRFFPSKARLHELTLYFLLHRHYMSAIAIQQTRSTTKITEMAV